MLRPCCASAASRNDLFPEIVGKLPTIAGWQPVLPGKIVSQHLLDSARTSRIIAAQNANQHC
jgi:hypothetical protein